MGNFRKNVFSAGSQPKNISAGVYTSAAPMRSSVAPGASGWHVPSSAGGGSQKRKRNDNGGGAVGFHGGPMRLSVSGAVIQNAPRSAAPAKPAVQSLQSSATLLPLGKDDASQKPSARSQRIMYVLFVEIGGGNCRNLWKLVVGSLLMLTIAADFMVTARQLSPPSLAKRLRR